MNSVNPASRLVERGGVDVAGENDGGRVTLEQGIEELVAAVMFARPRDAALVWRFVMRPNPMGAREEAVTFQHLNHFLARARSAPPSADGKQGAVCLQALSVDKQGF